MSSQFAIKPDANENPENTPEATPRAAIPRWYRRQLIVNPHMQYVFVFYAVSMGIILFSAGALVATLFHRYLVLRNYGWGLLDFADLFIVSCLVMIVVAGVYVGFVVSNNVAGPIFRLTREMIKAANGERVSKVNFRTNDHFHDLAEAYNKIVERMDSERK